MKNKMRKPEWAGLSNKGREATNALGTILQSCSFHQHGRLQDECCVRRVPRCCQYTAPATLPACQSRRTYLIIFINLDIQDQIPNLFAPLPIRIRRALRPLHPHNNLAHDLKLAPVDAFFAHNTTGRWLAAIAFPYDTFKDADAWVRCKR